jgi:transposase InsO family protein
MNRVIRLMHQAKLQARHKRRRLPGDTRSRQESHIAPNHLQRDFQASGPNQKWVADFTYIWTAEGWLYAAAVMDLYSRRIVGWSMSDTMQAKMVSDALLMALWWRGKPSSLMHHSDQGSQYDLPPTSRTRLKLVKSVNHQENDGYEDQQIQRRTDHWLSQASRGRAADQGDLPQGRIQ